jgi:organic hydroperoxide reductase OsmC/OhrA
MRVPCLGSVLALSVKVPVFTSIALSVELVVDVADEECARRVLVTAEQHCIIANALNVPVALEIKIAARARATGT